MTTALWFALAGILVALGLLLLVVDPRRKKPAPVQPSEAPPLFEPGPKPPGYRPGQQEDQP